jgi:hypothetical protein
MYRDVIIAGVNALAFQYLKMPDDAGVWFTRYQQGLSQMITDLNLPPRIDFILPA